MGRFVCWQEDVEGFTDNFEAPTAARAAEMFAAKHLGSGACVVVRNTRTRELSTCHVARRVTYKAVRL